MQQLLMVAEVDLNCLLLQGSIGQIGPIQRSKAGAKAMHEPQHLLGGRCIAKIYLFEDLTAVMQQLLMVAEVGLDRLLLQSSQV